ncbi:MAG: hypothetical protein Q8O13_05525 [Candidatus Omnitrophota bacterium]|nr:hypothetical protein [Candidatus Omnitrophota bacterium]
MKAVVETKAIRIYPMPDKTHGIMWKIHPPKSCWEEFDKEDWAQNKEELVNKINKIGEFILSKK